VFVLRDDTAWIYRSNTGNSVDAWHHLAVHTGEGVARSALLKQRTHELRALFDRKSYRVFYLGGGGIYSGHVEGIEGVLSQFCFAHSMIQDHERGSKIVLGGSKRAARVCQIRGRDLLVDPRAQSRIGERLCLFTGRFALFD